MTEITLVAYTFKHIQNLKRPIPSEWALPKRPLTPRSLDALRVIEQAENEGRNVSVSELAAALGISYGRTTQHVSALQIARRAKFKRVGSKRVLTTMFTAEDLAFAWYEEAPETPKEYKEHRKRLQRKEEHQRQLVDYFSQVNHGQ